MPICVICKKEIQPWMEFDSKEAGGLTHPECAPELRRAGLVGTMAEELISMMLEELFIANVDKVKGDPRYSSQVSELKVKDEMVLEELERRMGLPDFIIERSKERLRRRAARGA